jgi:hypothetical protein
VNLSKFGQCSPFSTEYAKLVHFKTSTPARGAHLSDGCRWRLEAMVASVWCAWQGGAPPSGHVASQARAREGTDVRPRGGADAARRGEVGALPHRCSFLLGGTPTAAAMKGPQWLRRRGPNTGAAAATKGPWIYTIKYQQWFYMVPLLKRVHQQQFIGTTDVDIWTSTAIVPMNRSW